MAINDRPNGCGSQHGGTLIEVLVSVLVLSLGMLGAAALQATALRNNQSNYERGQMTVLTQGMLDSMRANITGVTAGEYEMAAWTCAAPASAGLAKTDIAQWINSVQAQVNPEACARITCTARDCTVGIQWDDARATGGSSAQVFELRSQL